MPKVHETKETAEARKIGQMMLLLQNTINQVGELSMNHKMTEEYRATKREVLGHLLRLKDQYIKIIERRER